MKLKSLYKKIYHELAGAIFPDIRIIHALSACAISYDDPVKKLIIISISLNLKHIVYAQIHEIGHFCKFKKFKNQIKLEIKKSPSFYSETAAQNTAFKIIKHYSLNKEDYIRFYNKLGNWQAKLFRKSF